METDTQKIRVLLADDSQIALNIINNILSADPRIEVIGQASNGVEALSMVHDLKPDILCTDYHMPKMDGLELTRRLMSESPLPILVISISVQDTPDDKDNIFRLIEAGAVDVMPKPRGGFKADSAEANQLRQKVRLVAGVRVFSREYGVSPPVSKQHAAVKEVGRRTVTDTPYIKPEILVIGGSTGAPQIFLRILSSLPADFSIPIVCVQHINAQFAPSMVEWLNRSSPLRVKTAYNGERMQPGSAYFSGGSRHIEVDGDVLRVSDEKGPVNGHMPSVDVLFDSVARYYPNKSIAILLSGMGNDGAAGTKRIYDSGGYTMAQDQSSSVVFGMPMEAIRIDAASIIIKEDDIVSHILKIYNGRPGVDK